MLTLARKRKILFAASGTKFLSYEDTILRDSPSYYWNLNEESGLVANDSVGGAHGTISGGVTLNQSGAVGKGMLFDGSAGSKIVTSVNIPVTPIMTIEAWAKRSTSADYSPIFSNRGSAIAGTTRTIMLINYSSKAAYYSQHANPNLLTGTKLISDGQWHHVVLVINPPIVTIYVDGILDATQNPFIWTTTTVIPAFGWIGNDIEGSAPPWNGLIDEIAIYPYALSAQQIKAHFDARVV